MGACVSPWSRPSCIVYASVRPCVVIMELRLVWWRFFNMLMYVLFILMRVNALLRPCQPTESYAFFMSCRIIQASLFIENFASSHICVRIVMEPCIRAPKELSRLDTKLERAELEFFTLRREPNLSHDSESSARLASFYIIRRIAAFPNFICITILSYPTFF